MESGDSGSGSSSGDVSGATGNADRREVESSGSARGRTRRMRVGGDILPGEGGVDGPLGYQDKADLLGPPDEEEQDQDAEEVTKELAGALLGDDPEAVGKELKKRREAKAAMRRREEARLRRRTESGLEAGMRLLKDVSDEFDNPNKESSS